jgi:hypothetical protein
LLNPIEDDDGKGRHNQGSHACEQESFHRRSPKDFVDRKVIRKRFLRTTERLTSQLVPRWSAQRRTLHLHAYNRNKRTADPRWGWLPKQYRRVRPESKAISGRAKSWLRWRHECSASKTVDGVGRVK